MVNTLEALNSGNMWLGVPLNENLIKLDTWIPLFGQMFDTWSVLKEEYVIEDNLLNEFSYLEWLIYIFEIEDTLIYKKQKSSWRF